MSRKTDKPDTIKKTGLLLINHCSQCAYLIFFFNLFGMIKVKQNLLQLFKKLIWSTETVVYEVDMTAHFVIECFVFQ